MKRLLPLLLLFSLLPGTVRPASDPCPPPLPRATFLCSTAEEDHPWIFRRSYYSHDLNEGNRVVQYQPNPTVYRPADPTYMISGYRHNQLMFRGADGTADRLHVVETWGLGELIRPYGEWEYPYRAGATPYGPWGNPQGPWTLPFDSWVNPYGLGQLPWGSNYPPYPNSYRGRNPDGPHGGSWSDPSGPHGGSMPYPSGPHGGFSPHSTGPHGGFMPSPLPPPVPEE